MEFSKKLTDKFKEMHKEKTGKEVSDGEAQEALRNLADFFNLLWEIDQKDKDKKKRLKKEPQGFPVDGQYSCLVCGRCIDPSNGWYDWYGPMCIFCHRAYKTEIIPSFICENRNSYYDSYSLKTDFNFHYQTVKKMIRLGELKARIILNNQGKPYEYIFLKKENPHLIDPDRESPAMKSWKKNRDKVNDLLIKKEKAKMRAELASKFLRN